MEQTRNSRQQIEHNTLLTTILASMTDKLGGLSMNETIITAQLCGTSTLYSSNKDSRMASVQKNRSFLVET
jgi:hypothetical protein